MVEEKCLICEVRKLGENLEEMSPGMIVQPCQKHHLEKFILWQIDRRKAEFLSLLQEILEHLQVDPTEVSTGHIIDRVARYRKVSLKLAVELEEWLRSSPSSLPMGKVTSTPEGGTIEPMTVELPEPPKEPKK